MTTYEDELINLIWREISRAAMARPKRQIGLIDSYNNNDPTCKVKLFTDLDDDGQPKITGWIPFGMQGALQRTEFPSSSTLILMTK
jgi:hypothetical protein